MKTTNLESKGKLILTPASKKSRENLKTYLLSLPLKADHNNES